MFQARSAPCLDLSVGYAQTSISPFPVPAVMFASMVAIVFCYDYDYDSVACRGQGSELRLSLYAERGNHFQLS